MTAAESASINHDLPFEDGLCGSFRVDLEAVTDIFTRGGGLGEKSAHFFRVLPDGDYAINGTGLKGVIGAVLGAAAFGKLNRVENRSFGIRAPDDPAYQEMVTVKSSHAKLPAYEPRAKAGWLRCNDAGEWTLEPCEFARIEQKELERSAKEPVYLGDRIDAHSKYSRWLGVPQASLDLEVHVEAGVLPHLHGSKYLLYREAFVLPTPGTSLRAGRLVFTGQPAPRNATKGHPKHLEFVFLTRPTQPPSGPTFPVPDTVRREFEGLHDTDGGDWQQHWRPRMRSHTHPEAVPVFYLGDPTCLEGIGLALMPRRPGRFSLHAALGPARGEHLGDGLDLVEALFGVSNSCRILRGRVGFLPLRLVNPEHVRMHHREAVTAVLGSPKPSFYPNYLIQPLSPPPEKEGKLQGAAVTYLSDTGLMAGRKFYPVRPDRPGALHHPPGRSTERTAVQFRPLPAGSRFRGEVFVHNLRPFELGALLWALTIGEFAQPGPARRRLHLGMAKPLGYGSVRVSVSELRLRPNAPPPEDAPNSAALATRCLEEFVRWMEMRIPAWESSPQLRELVALSDPEHLVPDTQLQYPRLIPRECNDFREIRPKRKDDFPGLGLLPFSRLRAGAFSGVSQGERVDSARDTPRAAGASQATGQPEVGEIVSGVISGVRPFGAFVELDASRGRGLIHYSEMPSECSQDPGRVFEQGQSVRVRVQAIRPDGKLSLSLRDVRQQPE